MKSRAKNKIKNALRALLPSITLAEFELIEEIANRGHLRHLPPSISAWQATTTHIRHNHTDYDQLLTDGYDTESARHFVKNAINDKLEKWGSTKRLSEDENF